jgi:pimeloyl-ACP methyl ester carboxylesterase
MRFFTKPTRSSLIRTSLAAGALASGGWAAAQLYNRRRRKHLLHPGALPKVVDASLKTLPLPEGNARYYHRSGAGVPVVLVHSINAAGSTHEIAPIFEHLARATERPLYALDWLGFGQSDRPDLRYHPAIFVRQLQRFLRDAVGAPVDLVALSLSCEYAASVATDRPDAARRLVLIAPTGCAANEGPSAVGQFLVRASDRLDVFETFFYRLTRTSSLRRFYRKQVFPDSAPVPDALLRYAARTTHVRGAHRAPRYFVSSDLFTREAARQAYRRLERPTLVVTPERRDADLAQSFELLPDMLDANSRHLQHTVVGRGLLPQWETPDALSDAIMPFLSAS